MFKVPTRATPCPPPRDKNKGQKDNLAACIACLVKALGAL